MSKCYVCKNNFDDSEMYEYRGAVACEKDFDEAIKKRDFERAEVIVENRHQTKPFEGLSFGDNPVGRANRSLLAPRIEIAKKESMRTRLYERVVPMTNEEQLELIAQAKKLCERRVEGLHLQLIWQKSPEETVVEYSKLQLNSWTTHLAEMDEHGADEEGICSNRSCEYAKSPCKPLLTKAKRLLGVE